MKLTDPPGWQSEKSAGWRQIELPNWIVAVCVYSSWVLLIVYSGSLPWYALGLCGAVVLAWHFSLQHEAIHGWRSVPRWLRTAVVWPPIGGWLPYELYRHSHSLHHRDANLTVPNVDTESVYHRADDWEAYSKAWRGILLFNQTLLGRLVIGPLLRWRKLVINEAHLLRRRDFRNVGAWVRFSIGLAGILWFVSAVGGLPVWKYYLLFVYPGMSLSLLRAFIEHRWGETPHERIASVESNRFFGVLFLWNNIHIVHHLHPAMPWYDIPAYYRLHRHRLMELNGNYVFRGYFEIARHWLLRPVFTPVHPR